MKYTYAYKTSDGVRHEDSMNAASREEVFAALRKQGIKAIKVVAADGSKANGEVRGVRKRAVAALVGVAAVCVGVPPTSEEHAQRRLRPPILRYPRRVIRYTAILRLWSLSNAAISATSCLVRATRCLRFLHSRAS